MLSKGEQTSHSAIDLAQAQYVGAGATPMRVPPLGPPARASTQQAMIDNLGIPASSRTELIQVRVDTVRPASKAHVHPLIMRFACVSNEADI